MSKSFSPRAIAALIANRQLINLQIFRQRCEISSLDQAKNQFHLRLLGTLFICAAVAISGYGIIGWRHFDLLQKNGILEAGGDCFHVLGHSNFPIFAFTEHREHHSYQLVFRNMDSMAKLLEEIFPDVIVARLDELARPITKSDLSLIDSAELKHVNYWKLLQLANWHSTGGTRNPSRDDDASWLLDCHRRERSVSYVAIDHRHLLETNSPPWVA